jgi:hypothetical protein
MRHRTIKLALAGGTLALGGVAAPALHSSQAATVVAAHAARSQGFDLYNYSSHPIRLEHIAGPMRLIEARPRVGVVIQPGHSQHFEVEPLQDDRINTAWYEILNEHGQRVNRLVASMQVNTYNQPSAWCDAVGYVCTPPLQPKQSRHGIWNWGAKTFVFMDPPNSRVTVPSDKRQAQANVLKQLCESGSAAECNFDPASEGFLSGLEREKIGVTPHDVLGAYVLNKTDGVEAHKTIKVADTDGWSNTLGVELSASFKLSKVVDLGIKGKYEHEWHHDHTFEDTLSVSVPAHSLVWISVVSPKVDYTGPFMVVLRNTTWTLPDVTFSYPWPEGNPLWVINQKKL